MRGGGRIGVNDARLHMPTHPPKSIPNVIANTHKSSKGQIKYQYIVSNGRFDRNGPMDYNMPFIYAQIYIIYSQ